MLRILHLIRHLTVTPSPQGEGSGRIGAVSEANKSPWGKSAPTVSLNRVVTNVGADSISARKNYRNLAITKENTPMENLPLWLLCLLGYLALISLVAAVVTVYDKWAAKHRPRHRTPEKTLLILSALG
ncbi:MAG: DUF1294 domain-containing protein, partial [Clostridia bacterium]|nr:DUF1294 domain-containing protein [Clostridia bacterium]